MVLPIRFCLECKNFEDRMEIDGNIVCAKNHKPGVSCPDFQDRFESLRSTASKTRFCVECKNFENRTDVNGNVVCAKNHKPGVSCPDFQDRVTDIFYNYVYWSYFHSISETDEGKEYYEKIFSRKLSAQDMTYIILAEYFDLGLDYSDFLRCWSVARRIFEEKMPNIARILNAAVDRFNLHGERTNLRKAFLDVVLAGKKPEEVVKEVSIGFYKF